MSQCIGETIAFRNFGCVLPTGTKVMTATHGSGKVAGFRAEDIKYEISLDNSEDDPATVHFVPQNVSKFID